VSNRSEDHEVSMLALHLLQNCMVYINTLMLQHVNPYGRFELDMNDRLPLQ
jgi:TnpA family transposase